MKTFDETDTASDLGHNGGPPITTAPDPGHAWRLHCWRVALEEAWAPPPPEEVIRRVKRAKAVGVTYRQYTLEILERGRYL